MYIFDSYVTGPKKKYNSKFKYSEITFINRYTKYVVNNKSIKTGIK